MDYDIIAKLVLALCIGGLFADLLVIFAKTIILFAKAISKEYWCVSFRIQIWIAGILSLIIATYFIFI